MNGGFPVVIGRLAVSRAGRDKGRCVVIVGVADDDSVWVADGDLRKYNRPKRKKLKHLRLQPDVASEIAEKIQGEKTLQDKELRDVVTTWRQAREVKTRESEAESTTITE